MIECGADIERLLQQHLKPEGFRKKGRSWFHSTSEMVALVNLQRSSWGNTYYLNIGQLVRSIKDAPWKIKDATSPKIYECHHRIRLDSLFQEKPVAPAKVSPERLKAQALLDFHNLEFDARQREQELTFIVETRLLPFLRLCRTEAGLRTAIMEVLRSSIGATGVLRDHLDIPLVIDTGA